MNHRHSIFRTSFILLLAAALALCAGCGKKSASSVASSAAASASSTAEEAPQAEPLTQLNCISATSVPQVVELQDGMLLASWTDYSEEDSLGDITADSTTYLVLIDREEDEAVSTVVADVAYSLVQSFSDGNALLTYYDSDGTHYALCSPNLEITDLVLPANNGCFSSDGRLFYYVSGEVLCCYDISRQVSTPVELEYNLRFNYLDNLYANDTLLLCSVYGSNYSNTPCTAIVNVQSGKLMLLQDNYQNYFFTSDSFFSYDCDYSEEVFSLSRSALDGDTLSNFALSMGYDEMNGYYGLQSISGSDYLYISYDPALDGGEEGEGDRSSTDSVKTITLLRLTDTAIESCSLTNLGIPGMAYYAVGLSDGTILFSTYQDDGTAALYCVSPEVLTYSSLALPESSTSPAVDQDLLNSYLAEQEAPKLASELSDVQAQANELGSKYDVDILLSNACQLPCSYSGYEVVTSDQAGWENEAATISRALTQLEEVLSVYPEGFFSQFRTEAANSGVCFLLAGPITSESGPNNVVAFEYSVSNRYYVCADLTYYQLTSNFHHELWHAIEGKLSNDNADNAFYDDDWTACNPVDFCYDYSFDNYDSGTDSGKWTTYGGEEVYFVDDYSRTFPSEDRGRIWENAMADESSARTIVSYDHLQDKLQLMNAAIRADFDTTGWGTPRWEAFV